MSNLISSTYFLDAMTCEDDEYNCHEGYPTCIHTSMICDGVPHCMKQDDENTCGEHTYHMWCIIHPNIIVVLIAGNCGGVFKNRNGHLTSPAYPILYPNSDSCVYKISQPNDTYIKLKILKFNLTFDTSCNDDYLEIRDGYTAASPLIGKFCGNDIPTAIESSQNNVWLR